MSPMELWCNESQERYVLIVDAAKLDDFAAIARRERCPFAVIGEIDDTGVLVLEDKHARHASGGPAARSVARQGAEDAARRAPRDAAAGRVR